MSANPMKGPDQWELYEMSTVLSDEQARTEQMILSTPTGKTRERLTEVNIHLMAAIAKLREID